MILLSYPISEDTPIYGNGVPPQIKQDRRVENGDSCNTMQLNMSNHTGTHIDFPFHFDPKGKTICDYPVEFWLFDRIELIQFNEPPMSGQIITKSDIKQIVNPNFNALAEVVIIRTGWSQFRNKEKYWKTPPGIHSDVSDFLRNQFPTIKCLGMDLISISSFSNSMLGRESHRSFLNHNHPILLIEDMDLNIIPKNGINNLLISPIYIKEADGSPCNVYCNIPGAS